MDSSTLYAAMHALKILDEFRGMPAREDALFDQLRIMCPGVDMKREKFAGLLEYLRGKGFVSYNIPKLGPKTWKISVDGKNAVRDWQYEEEEF